MWSDKWAVTYLTRPSHGGSAIPREQTVWVWTALRIDAEILAMQELIHNRRETLEFVSTKYLGEEKVDRLPSNPQIVS